MRRGQATLCPECGAQDSLEQHVTAECSGIRPVSIVGPEGAAKVAFGPTERDTFDESIIDEESITCARCKTTWADEKDLFDIGPPVEHRCVRCNWWGYNDFSHDLERPGCSGLVYRVDKPPAVVVA